MEHYRRDISKIYMLVALSCLLLTASYYLFGFRPLAERLEHEHANEITHSLDSGLWLLQGVLTRHHDLARQSASRTAIRKKQVAYLDGTVSKAGLADYSVPKLGDALRANQELVGISRFGPQGTSLFSVGIAVPESIVARCEIKNLRQIRMLEPVDLKNKRRLLYCSPIMDNKAGYVGADILVFNETAINLIMETELIQSGIYAIVSDGEILYWPRTQEQETASARKALESHLQGQAAGNNHIIQSKKIPNHDWELYLVVNKERFFADIRRQLLVMLGIILLISLAVIVLTMLTLRPVIRALMREKELLELSHRDGLTGLYNHAYMHEFLEYEISRARRFQHPLSVLMFDLDHFKQVNDNFGHQAGDRVLKQVSEIVLQEIRKIDVAVRYGGEEFMLILPETDQHGAAILAERLRKAISTETADLIPVNISIGVVTCTGCNDYCTKEDMIRMADNALYESKHKGRNRVTSVISNRDSSMVSESMPRNSEPAY